MCKLLVVFFTNCLLLLMPVSDGNDIFHVNSKVTFYPDSLSEYFGYTVVLTNSRVVIGAPKAKSRVNDNISPGLVFTCRLESLDQANVTCYPLGMDDGIEKGQDIFIRPVVTVKNNFRDDMWFGATIASLPAGKLLACGPRWTEPYRDKHLLANGACYLETKKQEILYTPLKEQRRLAFLTDGNRKEYGEYGTHLNFYAHGQAGMSVKVTELDGIIIGAPGLMQWTGGIIDYRFSPDANSVYLNKMPISNPYYTKELGPDDYFGYSVESGIFEVNGSTLYVAGAPRSKMGYGQVLVFKPVVQEMIPLEIRVKLQGPQIGSYFGATLCSSDINNDGRSDLLVGAPNYIRKDGGFPFDQGAVFVYLAGGEGKALTLLEAGYVSGSEKSGARFGSSIADIGDVDGDGYRDIAVGAPWENEAAGVVYIYRGSGTGLKNKYTQRILAETGRGFGISIAKAVDVDGNHCNDLVIGAHISSTAYLYRCIPTMQVHSTIKVPNAMNLPQNATNFTALFCVTVPAKKYRQMIEIDLKASIIIDAEVKPHRAMISGDAEYTLYAKPGEDICHEQVVEVKSTADLSRPISLKFKLAPIVPEGNMFSKRTARLSEDSTLESSFLIQLIRDCGDDLICTPWLVMFLDSLNTHYIPGTNGRLAVIVTVLNKEEPAYGTKVKLLLPLPPKRMPGACSLDKNMTKDEVTTSFNITCELPAPLPRGESVTFEIELEYTLEVIQYTEMSISALLEDPFFRRKISDGVMKNITMKIQPMADFRVSGKTLPNTTLTITREKFDEGGTVQFVHFFEVTNFGPSDWSTLEATFEIPSNVTLSKSVSDCERMESTLNCSWSIAANVSLPIELSLKFDLKKYGQYFDEILSYNATTNLILHLKNSTISSNITTYFILETRPSIWPYIVGFISGFLLLSVIVYGLYKYGFFSRSSRDELKLLQETSESIEASETDEAGDSRPISGAGESRLELLDDDLD